MPPTAASHPDDVAALLSRAERLAARRLRTALEETGCSVESWRVLSLLSESPGQGMTAIADRTQLPPPTLTRLVDQLVDDGLVHRRVDPLDRRRVVAGLTPRGREAHLRLAERVRAVWSALPADEDDPLLVALLDRLIARLEVPVALPAPAINGR
ncbi:MarR family winged helix-turn-helix transcriptional regulator [Streptomyces triticirhizae]|uniref:MarR family transcriptional regulator n=1 Tax=Streptomyces triticirhizae TaxID=2483353 RepID=A0A3M2MB75_9ACTN|nr:MarR family transcriptional regulator [Streptomyces triticirhizae]RMI46250.1 MarR family transcriptional regulator [Streptomyces triticirhizae]